MGITARDLERMGIHERPEAVEELLHQALRELLLDRLAPDPRRSLTPADVEALRRGGFDLEPRDRDLASPIVRGAASYAAMIASSLTAIQTAQRLGVDDSRVRQRLSARTLYGVKLRSGWRIPVFQFEGDSLLPGLAEVLPKLTPGLHPLVVQGFFLSPNPALVTGEEETPTSPRNWLLSGGDPARVGELIAELGSGI